MKSIFRLDSPTLSQFTRTATNHFFRGWFIDTNGKPAKAIRIRIGKRIVNCSPVARPDVIKHLAGKGVSEIMIGFQVSFKTGAGFKFIIIEVLDEDNQ